MLPEIFKGYAGRYGKHIVNFHCKQMSMKNAIV